MDRHHHTIEARDRAEDQAIALYAELFLAERARQRAEWEEEFGDDQRFPFKPNGLAMHNRVMAQMDALREEP